MTLRFIGIDPATDGDECPTVWVDEATADLVIQGWRADEVTEAECRESGKIPDTEGVVRIPVRMAQILREACDAAERERAKLQ
ncbi:hypothetical protein GL263_15185 [Streptomyces durbertensis]|uniref:Uncharacterized protein n=1 Tax=Streptomyces durbertensis TaxID=2448886 RepID=A0ABR6EI10_9ACTN|nr:hypothetical protein [Streptomyces durbertensis]MBB1244898.1 hypothetical protein [Streptomyces durbertensis]